MCILGWWVHTSTGLPQGIQWPASPLPTAILVHKLSVGTHHGVRNQLSTVHDLSNLLTVLEERGHGHSPGQAAAF